MSTWVGAQLQGLIHPERARPILRGGGAADYFEVLAAGKFEMFRPEDSETSKIR